MGTAWGVKGGATRTHAYATGRGTRCSFSNDRMRARLPPDVQQRAAYGHVEACTSTTWVGVTLS
eukprot:359236-Chlamydomonas_euryale.AAC.16